MSVAVYFVSCLIDTDQTALYKAFFDLFNLTAAYQSRSLEYIVYCPFGKIDTKQSRYNLSDTAIGDIAGDTEIAYQCLNIDTIAYIRCYIVGECVVVIVITSYGATL